MAALASATASDSLAEERVEGWGGRGGVEGRDFHSWRTEAEGGQRQRTSINTNYRLPPMTNNRPP